MKKKIYTLFPDFILFPNLKWTLFIIYNGLLMFKIDLWNFYSPVMNDLAFTNADTNCD